MKTLPAFASFERGLRSDHEATERHQLEVLGVEPEAVKKRGPGRPKSPALVETKPRIMIGVQADLGQQLEHLAAALDTQALSLARSIMGAGIEALVRELESTGKVTIPLRLDVGKEGKGHYYQYVRTVTPERFESLRHLHTKRLSRWKEIRQLPGDTTGVPMPPPPCTSR